MAFVKFEENRFRIDEEISENHAILVNLTASIVEYSTHRLTHGELRIEESVPLRKMNYHLYFLAVAPLLGSAFQFIFLFRSNNAVYK